MSEVHKDRHSIVITCQAMTGARYLHRRRRLLSAIAIADTDAVAS